MRGLLALLLAAEALALRLQTRRLAESLAGLAAALVFLAFLLVFLHLALYLALSPRLSPLGAALAVGGMDLLVILLTLLVSFWAWRRRSRQLREATALRDGLRRTLLDPARLLLALWEAGRRR